MIHIPLFGPFRASHPNNHASELVRFSRVLLIGCSSLLLLLPNTARAESSPQAAQGVVHSSSSVTVNQKRITVDRVTADLSDPQVEVSAVSADGGVGRTESFSSMVQRTGAAAAINGTYFEAYQKDAVFRTPYGLLYQSPDLLFDGDKDISLSISADKLPEIRRLKLSSTVSIGGRFQADLGGVHTPESLRNDIFGYLYTQDDADTITFSGIKIAADSSGTVTAISDSAMAIPPGGQVLVLASRDGNWQRIAGIRVGDPLRVSTSMTDKDSGAAISPNSLLTAMGAGPRLVTQGAVDINYERDGFSDPRITTQTNIRSFVGIDRYGMLTFGTLSPCTLEEGASALVELGIQEAMNLDGGASSAFYADGRIRRPAGRLLSSFLIVRQYDAPQVQIAYNGELLTGVHGIMDHSSTLVPCRVLMNRLGAEYSWVSESSTLSITKGQLNVSLTTGSRMALVNGNTVTMDAEAKLIQGHLYVPLRFLSETFGAAVKWDSKLYRASLNSPSVQSPPDQQPGLR